MDPNLTIAKSTPPPKGKKLLLPLFVLLGVTAVALLGYFAYNHFFSQKIQPTLLDEKNMGEVINELHPDLFVAQLELDPATGMVKELEIDQVSGDEPRLFSNPSQDPNDFNFRVEVLSNKKEIITSGWSSQAKDRITKINGTMVFYVVVKYETNNTLNVYLEDNKLAWTTKVK